MRKDIPIPQPKNVYVVVKHEAVDQESQWSVHLLNENSFPIKNVLMVSRGYGKTNGKEEETSVIRQLFEEVGPNSAVQIELIQTEVFHLFNEYTLTYYVDNQIYDKKCIFVPESITVENLVQIDLLDAQGVLHS